METKEIFKNNKEQLGDIKNKNMLKKIKCKYISIQIFQYLNQRKTLQIIKYNKTIQKFFDIGENDFKKFCETEIEIIPDENILLLRKDPFINFNNKNEESYYHIYYNGSKKETKRKNKNYLKKNVKKIKIIIDYQVKSFEELFSQCY